MTELSPSGTVAPLSDPTAAALSGRPAIGVDLLLTDADGRGLCPSSATSRGTCACAARR
jgi:hypothetical protein